MKTIKGDLIELAKNGEFDVIVHGCNCFHTMGGGIAKQIRENFPDAYEEDCKTLKGDKSKLGSFTASRVSHWSMVPALFQGTDPFFVPEVSVFYIINAYTQYYYGPNKHLRNPCHFDYDAFETFLHSFVPFLKLHFESNGFSSKLQKIRVGFPKIGCGLAGGNWPEVGGILYSFSDRVGDFVNVTVVEL